MEGGDLDNFKCKNYKDRTNEQNLGILRKLTEVSSFSEKKKRKTSEDPETARKTEARWVTQKEGSECRLVKWGGSQETQTGYCV